MGSGKQDLSGRLALESVIILAELVGIKGFLLNHIRCYDLVGSRRLLQLTPYSFCITIEIHSEAFQKLIYISPLARGPRLSIDERREIKFRFRHPSDDQIALL